VASETEPEATPERRAKGSGLTGAIARMSGRERWGWIVTGLGFVVILWGVLHLTSATIGGPIHEFKDRRTYNEVKIAAHRAFPVTLLLGFTGMGLVALGGRLRASGRRPERGV
jgi:hypothetical protein